MLYGEVIFSFKFSRPNKAHEIYINSNTKKGTLCKEYILLLRFFFANKKDKRLCSEMDLK